MLVDKPGSFWEVLAIFLHEAGYRFIGYYVEIDHPVSQDVDVFRRLFAIPPGRVKNPSTSFIVEMRIRQPEGRHRILKAVRRLVAPHRAIRPDEPCIVGIPGPIVLEKVSEVSVVDYRFRGNHRPNFEKRGRNFQADPRESIASGHMGVFLRHEDDLLRIRQGRKISAQNSGHFPT